MRDSCVVVVVDDDPSLLHGLSGELVAAGYVVFEARSSNEAVAAFRREGADLIVTDLSMPGGDGFRLIETVRRESAVPILVLSVRDGESDKVRALDLGADDYVTKPFAVGELLARVRSQLRRSSLGAAPILRFPGLIIDVERKIVTRDVSEIHLTPTEFAILIQLASRPGKPVTPNEIIRTVWNGAPGTTVDAVRVHVSSLRKKIERDPAEPRYIVTEPWVGYRFIAEPE
ncbi:MAG TPA: response regulator transcription factor [Thermoanaerobaculia bacterium]|nr:response regulator transcription factor [Thermoanaerobaculia bacterium]